MRVSTWTHLGLRDGQQIPRIAVDPRDPNKLFVAVLGHPYGPNEERGLFRSTDGGQTFQKVLYKDENTGANDVEVDPANPDIIYTSFWEARQGPWENAQWNGTNGGIFKSTDGGKTWRLLTKGLPTGPASVEQANIAIAPSNSSRLYAAIATGRDTALYRSDDAGENWSRVTTDPRPAERIGGGDLPVPAVDPQNPDVVYSASIVTWKSVDGGKTWTGIRGAPGGDDYQSIWINPNNPRIMLVVSDQGAIVTVNGGETWSDWYNQPTAQLYHVAADNAFPYRVCSGQQESGSVCIASAATMDKSPCESGIRLASRSMATRFPIRSTRILSLAARSRVTIAARDRFKTSAPKPSARPAIAPCVPLLLSSRLSIRMSFTSAPTLFGKRRMGARAGLKSVPICRAKPGVFRRASENIAILRPPNPRSAV